MLSKKLRQLVAQRDRRRSHHTRNRLTGIEGLENRVVMTVNALSAIVGTGDVAGPVQEVMTRSTPEVSARIVNGTPTSSFASVGLVGDTGGSFCSGTLISPSHVLTAGHCAVGVGSTQGRFIVGGQTYSTNRVLVHPQYNDQTLSNDIAIYSLSSSVANVTPSPINRITPVVGQTLTLVGFGAGGTGNTGHNGDFGTKRVGTTPIDNVTSTLITWRFDNNSESNTAPGDSGGPAFLQSSGTYFVAGVTSGGDNANSGIGDNSFDTRVDAYASWIDSIVGQQPNPNPNPNPSVDDHVNQPGATATLVTLNGAGAGVATGSLEKVGDRDVFRVVVSNVGVATFGATGTSGLDTYLRVFDSSGNLVAQNDDFGGTLNSQTTLDVAPGVYYVSVGSYADSEAGQYRLNIQFVARIDSNPLPGAKTLTLDASGRGRADGAISSGNQSERYTFRATVTGRLTIQAQARSGNLDTILTVYDASGKEVAFNDDYRGGADSRVLLEVNAGVSYTVELSSWGGTTGSFRLSLSTRAARNADSGLIVSGINDSHGGTDSALAPDGTAEDVFDDENIADGDFGDGGFDNSELDDEMVEGGECSNHSGEEDWSADGGDSFADDDEIDEAWSDGEWDEVEFDDDFGDDDGFTEDVRDPFDVNDDGRYTPLDALHIINYLNTPSGQRATDSPQSAASSKRFDVNLDGAVTPLDALMVINRLNSPTIARRTDGSNATERGTTPRRETVTAAGDKSSDAEIAIVVAESVNDGVASDRSRECNHADEWEVPWFGDNDPFSDEENWLL